MKRVFLLFALTVIMAGAFAQQSNQEIRVDPRLKAVLGDAKFNDLRMNDPKQLVIENSNLVHYCYLAMKMTEPEGTYQMKGDLKNYVKDGKSCNYPEIIATGAINRYDFNLEQDAYKQNVYSLGSTGAYIIVNSKQKFDNNLNALLRTYGIY